MSTTVMGVRRSVAAGVGERQILVRVKRGGMLISEGELRYQQQRKDTHPLAREPELLDVLAEFEERGVIESALCVRLTAAGRERLAELDADEEG